MSVWAHFLQNCPAWSASQPGAVEHAQTPCFIETSAVIRTLGHLYLTGRSRSKHTSTPVVRVGRTRRIFSGSRPGRSRSARPEHRQCNNMIMQRVAVVHGLSGVWDGRKDSDRNQLRRDAVVGHDLIPQRGPDHHHLHHTHRTAAPSTSGGFEPNRGGNQEVCMPTSSGG